MLRNPRLLHAAFLSSLVVAPAAAQSWSPDFADPAEAGLGLDSGIFAAHALGAFDSGAGPELYFGGAFTTAGPVPVRNLARWTGSGWADVGGGVGVPGFGFSYVSALEVFDDGSGPALYVGGLFTDAGGLTVDGIARWDGAAWSDVGGGVSGGVFGFAGEGTVSSLAVFDDGSGPALYVGGSFSFAGGAPASSIARWDGSTWSEVGGGFSGPFGPCCIYDLFVWDDGSGEALYAATESGSTGSGVSTGGVLRWDGTSWSTLGGGVSGALFNFGAALEAWDDGSGEALYLGGGFAQAGVVPAANVARWDGTSWQALGSGVTGQAGVNPPQVGGLAVFDAGDGPELWVGGFFDQAGGQAASGLARWNGTSWQTPIGGGLFGGDQSYGADMLVFDSSLWISGTFEAAGAHESTFIARFGPLETRLTADIGELELASGGTQTMFLDSGAASAGRPYFVLGSLTGKFPGVDLTGLGGAGELPLVPDIYFNLIVTTGQPLTGAFGLLDAQGRATVALTLPAGLPPSLVGTTVYHAGLEFGLDGGIIDGSNAVQLVIR